MRFSQQLARSTLTLDEWSNALERVPCGLSQPRTDYTAVAYEENRVKFFKDHASYTLTYSGPDSPITVWKVIREVVPVDDPAFTG